MNTIAWVHFAALLIITGALFRYIENMWPNSWIGRTLGVIY